MLDKVTLIEQGDVALLCIERKGKGLQGACILSEAEPFNIDTYEPYIELCKRLTELQFADEPVTIEQFNDLFNDMALCLNTLEVLENTVIGSCFIW